MGSTTTRNAPGAEIDFILQQKGIALECKISGTQQELKALRKTAEGLGLNKSYIINQKFHKEEGFLPVIVLQDRKIVTLRLSVT